MEQQNSATKNPPPGYVVTVSVPKDQVFFIPPQERAKIMEDLARHRSLDRCCQWFPRVLILTLFLFALVSGVLYIIFWPRHIKYSVQSLSVEALPLASPRVSPVFNVTVKADNLGKRTGIHYKEGGSVSVLHSGISLGNGAVPSFYQRPNNVTFLRAVLNHSEIYLSKNFRQTLMKERKQGKVKFVLNLKAPLRFKLGFISMAARMKVSCDVMMNGLMVDSEILSQDCDVDVGLRKRVKFW
ncbi:hypothetical protein L1049_028129 [Liquidambar formosana]|uniref:Late embryogenesis abundant protein LEA-2 subgroup domain-containing protein n=1 Tax=Liquidambar formosana TaxID=63359 RepID=A0AAP0WT36_LIQFO